MGEKMVWDVIDERLGSLYNSVDNETYNYVNELTLRLWGYLRETLWDDLEQSSQDEIEAWLNAVQRHAVTWARNKKH